MDNEFAGGFVQTWLDGWNTHDLDAVMTHFADDVVFTSPVAAQLIPGSKGVVHGKAALREYWNEGLRHIPDLRFELVDFYVGVETLVINYRNQRGGLVNEVLVFEGIRVMQGHGTYQSAEGNPSGARITAP